MGLTWGFGFSFFTKNFHEPCCMEHQFLDCTDPSSVVEADGGSRTGGRRVVKPWSTHTCGAQLSTAFPGPGWVCLCRTEPGETLHCWPL